MELERVWTDISAPGARNGRTGTIYFVRILKIYSWDREKEFRFIHLRFNLCDSSTQREKTKIEFKSRK